MCWRGFHKILERHRQSRAVVARYGADDTERRRTYPARDRKRRQPLFGVLGAFDGLFSRQLERRQHSPAKAPELQRRQQGFAIPAERRPSGRCCEGAEPKRRCNERELG